MKWLLSSIIFLSLTNCAHRQTWSHDSEWSAEKAYNALTLEIQRCFPSAQTSHFKLDELGEYQIKSYSSTVASGDNAQALYLLKIKSDGKKSIWEVASSEDMQYIENFENTHKLCD